MRPTSIIRFFVSNLIQVLKHLFNSLSFRGNLSKAIEMFDKAIALTKTELEMSHLFSLKDAAMAQKAVAEKMNMRLPRDVFNA